MFLDRTLSGPIGLFAKFSILQVSRLQAGVHRYPRAEWHRTMAWRRSFGSTNRSLYSRRKTSFTLRDARSRMHTP